MCRCNHNKSLLCLSIAGRRITCTLALDEQMPMAMLICGKRNSPNMPMRLDVVFRTRRPTLIVLCIMLFISTALPLAANKIPVAPPPSFYPRIIQDVSGATWLAAFESPTPAVRSLSFAVASTSHSPVTFRTISTIFSSSETGVDVANPHLLQLLPPPPSSSSTSLPLLLCAFRHHSMSAAPAPVYRIQTVVSRDNGSTWSVLLQIVQRGTRR